MRCIRLLHFLPLSFLAINFILMRSQSREIWEILHILKKLHSNNFLSKKKTNEIVFQIEKKQTKKSFPSIKINNYFEKLFRCQLWWKSFWASYYQGLTHNYNTTPFTPPVPPLNVKLRLQKLGTVPNYFFLLFLTQYLAVNYSFEFLSLVALYFYQYHKVISKIDFSRWIY